MNYSKVLFRALITGVLFLVAHIVILLLKLNEIADLILVLGTMVLMQLLAFRMLRKDYGRMPITFKEIFLQLCLTQTFSVIFLTLYSTINPFGENMPVHMVEVIISLLIFAGVLPLIVTTAIWFFSVKRRNEGI